MIQPKKPINHNNISEMKLKSEGCKKNRLQKMKTDGNGKLRAPRRPAERDANNEELHRAECNRNDENLHNTVGDNC